MPNSTLPQDSTPHMANSEYVPASEALLETAIRNATARLEAAVAGGAGDAVLAARSTALKRLTALRAR